MRRHWLAIPLAVLAFSFSAAQPDPISELLALPASALDPALPGQPFDDWLRKQLPPGAVPVFRTRPCEATEGTCVEIEIDVVSRARVLRLDCAVDPPRFASGAVERPDGSRQHPIERLADLRHHLTEPIRPRPLQCPEGTRNVLRNSGAGLHEWCQDAAGLKQGPARSWYSAGRYLMWRGEYRDGERTGLWTECDRFERCRTRTYR